MSEEDIDELLDEDAFSSIDTWTLKPWYRQAGYIAFIWGQLLLCAILVGVLLQFTHVLTIDISPTGRNPLIWIGALGGSALLGILGWLAHSSTRDDGSMTLPKFAQPWIDTFRFQ